MTKPKSKPAPEPQGATAVLDGWLIRALDSVAHEENRSRADQIRTAVQEMLRGRGRQRDPETGEWVKAA